MCSSNRFDSIDHHKVFGRVHDTMKHPNSLSRRATMADEIKMGEIVRLKSSGPKMTVEAVFTDVGGQMCVRCSWFDKQDNKISDAFALEAVELA
jgi:uncharacterized protein YodC (DUF2158 family)